MPDYNKYFNILNCLNILSHLIHTVILCGGYYYYTGGLVRFLLQPCCVTNHATNPVARHISLPLSQVCGSTGVTLLHSVSRLDLAPGHGSDSGQLHKCLLLEPSASYLGHFALQHMAEAQASRPKVQPRIKPVLLSHPLMSDWPRQVTWPSPHFSGLGIIPWLLQWGHCKVTWQREWMY